MAENNNAGDQEKMAAAAAVSDWSPVIQEESSLEKAFRKFKSDPIVPLGMLGFFGMATYGIREFKNRGNMPASVYLMHLRVKAQSIVVGAMTLAVGYHLMKDFTKSKPPPEVSTDH
ncbi:PREDICTED: HIG1 domain family member 1A, mitochondrial-like [Priapulus caudatus]|uniref:HIG1 domain family member 1A, mitochondrial-like n=1 Tax=Priapulus caudatus TaxID=37621 RepID=A0ABM1E1V5_PRICU|nr:PREDICTED: HIG1 domain family member 1A, mitochondrial-like [Priapulus caudatus]